MVFCNITGIFSKAPKEYYSDFMSNSIGFNDSDKITDMVIPISVISAHRKERILFNYPAKVDSCAIQQAPVP